MIFAFGSLCSGSALGCAYGKKMINSEGGRSFFSLMVVAAYSGHTCNSRLFILIWMDPGCVPLCLFILDFNHVSLGSLVVDCT